MAIDNLGREIDGMSSEEMAKGMLSPVGKPTIHNVTPDKKEVASQTEDILKQITPEIEETIRSIRNQVNAAAKETRQPADRSQKPGFMDRAKSFFKPASQPNFSSNISQSLRDNADSQPAMGRPSLVERAVIETKKLLDESQKFWKEVKIKDLVKEGLKSGSIKVADDSLKEAVDMLAQGVEKGISVDGDKVQQAIKNLHGWLKDKGFPAIEPTDITGDQKNATHFVDNKAVEEAINHLNLTPPPTKPPTGHGSGNDTPDYDPNYKLLKFSLNTINDLIGATKMWDTVMDGVTSGDTLVFKAQLKDIAFQTKGITGDMKDLQEEWTEVNRVSGVSLSDTQKIFQKNIGRGIKSLAEEKKVLHESLSLSTMIGSNAEETASMFHNWNVQLGLGSGELSEVSRSIQRISRETGVTGDHLLAATKSAEALLHTYRDMGGVTSQVAENVLSMTTASQKFGVGDTYQRLQQGLQNGMEAMQNPEIQSAVGFASQKMNPKQRSEMIQQLKGGTLKVEDLVEPIKNTMEAIFKKPIEQWDQLTVDQKFQMRAMLKKAGFAGEGQFTNLYKATQEAEMYTKHFASTLGDVTDKMKLANGQEKIRLERQATELKLNKAESFLQGVATKSQKPGMDLTSAAKEMMDEMGPTLIKDIQAIDPNADVSSPQAMLQTVQKIMKDNFKSFNGQDMTGDLSDAISKGDAKSFNSILESSLKNQTDKGTKTSTQTSELKDQLEQAREANDHLRKITDYLQELVVGLLGGKGMFVLGGLLGLATIAGKALLLFKATIFETLAKKSWQGIKKLPGMGRFQKEVKAGAEVASEAAKGTSTISEAELAAKAESADLAGVHAAAKAANTGTEAVGTGAKGVEDALKAGADIEATASKASSIWYRLGQKINQMPEAVTDMFSSLKETTKAAVDVAKNSPRLAKALEMGGEAVKGFAESGVGKVALKSTKFLGRLAAPLAVAADIYDVAHNYDKKTSTGSGLLQAGMDTIAYGKGNPIIGGGIFLGKETIKTGIAGHVAAAQAAEGGQKMQDITASASDKYQQAAQNASDDKVRAFNLMMKEATDLRNKAMGMEKNTGMFRSLVGNGLSSDDRKTQESLLQQANAKNVQAQALGETIEAAKKAAENPVAKPAVPTTTPSTDSASNGKLDEKKIADIQPMAKTESLLTDLLKTSQRIADAISPPGEVKKAVSINGVNQYGPESLAAHKFDAYLPDKTGLDKGAIYKVLGKNNPSLSGKDKTTDLDNTMGSVVDSLATTGMPGSKDQSAVIPASMTSSDDVYAAPLQQVQDRISQQYAAQQSAATAQPNKEMARIAEANDKQVALLSQLVQGQEKIIDLLSPSTGSGESGGKSYKGTDRRVPKGSRDYGKLQYGSVYNNATRQVVSTGLV